MGGHRALTNGVAYANGQTIGGILYVDRRDLVGAPNIAVEHGSLGRIFYNTKSQRWYTAQGQDVTQFVRVMSRFHFLDPEEVEGYPKYFWPTIGTVNPPLQSYHLDAQRWVRVTAFLDSDGASLSVPLMINDYPLCDPSMPPALVCVRGNYSTTDRVTAPGASGVQWTDVGALFRPNGGTSTSSQTTRAVLKPASEPVPHWVLLISTLGGSSPPQTTINVCVDMLSNMTGGPDTQTSEVGSSGVAGHYQIWNMWPTQGFQAATNRNNYNEKRHQFGAIDVAAASGSGSLFMTTGAGAGTSAGTSDFGTSDNDMPAVVVHGHTELNTSVASLTSSNWKPETWGMGVPATLHASVDRSKLFQTSVEKDTTSGKWKVNVVNFATTSPTHDRTFFAWAWGRS